VFVSAFISSFLGITLSRTIAGTIVKPLLKKKLAGRLHSLGHDLHALQKVRRHASLPSSSCASFSLARVSILEGQRPSTSRSSPPMLCRHHSVAVTLQRRAHRAETGSSLPFCSRKQRRVQLGAGPCLSWCDLFFVATCHASVHSIFAHARGHTHALTRARNAVRSICVLQVDDPIGEKRLKRAATV
jgi:hypothetical protein